MSPLARIGVLVGAVVLVSCGGRSAGTVADGSVPPDGQTPLDGSPPMDASPQPDADTQTRPCQCEGGEVWRFHECVPTHAVGCGATCGDPADCGAGWTCEACGAATACDTRDCRPTCVFSTLSQGPLDETLRISPTSGTAGQDADVTVMGFPFYIGALMYGVRLGDEDVTSQVIHTGGTCSFTVRLPAKPPGRYPLYVSTYGPMDPWFLAGFYTYSGGVVDDCAQPYLHCGAFAACCETAAVPMSCLAGRCRSAP